MEVIKYPDADVWKDMLSRPGDQAFDRLDEVRDILDRVRMEGDEALRELAMRFDNAKLDSLVVDQDILVSCWEEADEAFRAAVIKAASNIRRFHAAQKESEKRMETTPGISCWRRSVAIETIGIYVPGGTAPLFSSLLMNAIPAQVAGCRNLVVCTPPNQEGRPAASILAVAGYLGLEKIYISGGAQAIGAMAFGTETIPKVDKIFGPGNSWVTAAKQLVQQVGTAIDLPAGPSEVLVIADETADPEFVATDLLSQAEHGKDSQVILVTSDETVLTKTMQFVGYWMEKLPRKDIIREALTGSRAILVHDLQTAVAISNLYAPEHLILQVREPENWLEDITQAGSVFLGPWSCESLGDYASGTNHTLPTSGLARIYSGVSLDSFVRKMTCQKVTPRGLKELGPTVEIMAAAESLDAHKLAVEVRMDRLDKMSPVKTSRISELIPIRFDHIRPYSSARSEYSGDAALFMDANEWPFLDRPYRRYPDPLHNQLREAYASWRGLSKDFVSISNGSDEAIEWLIRGFCEPGIDSICICPPTYGMYEIVASWFDVPVQRVLLTSEYQPDIPALKAVVQEWAPKILFLCSPNNPTGQAIDSTALIEILSFWPGLVVVDEAYIDFHIGQSMASLIPEYECLVVLQTFSKSFGMAGLRVGTLLADPQVISHMDRIKAPYNVNSYSAQMALEALKNREKAIPDMELLRNERKKLVVELGRFSNVIEILPSDANFLTLIVEDPSGLVHQLRAEGIVIRDRNTQLPGAVRITVGTPEQNAQLLKTWAKLLEQIKTA